MGTSCSKPTTRDPWAGAVPPRYDSQRRPGYLDNQPHPGYAYYQPSELNKAPVARQAIPAPAAQSRPPQNPNLHLGPQQAASTTTSGTTTSANRDTNAVEQPAAQIAAPSEVAAQPSPALDKPPIAEQQHAESAHAAQPQPMHQQTTFNWTKGKLIGAGAFGRVFQGLDNDTGHILAVKQVALTKDEALKGRVAEHIRTLEAEVALLRQLNHVNIVRYLGTERTEDTLNIFLEYVPGGSIASLIEKFGALQESVIRRYTQQILQGLEYLHQRKIMHRDIKGANILVDPQGCVKLADFGASRKIEDLATVGSGSKSIRGTPYWMAPEVIKQTGHGRPADIWSLGCVVIEMATGKPPWSNCNTQVAAMFHIASTKEPPPLPDNLSPEAKDFLLLCFNRVPKDRPNATRLLRHPWLANIPGPSTSLAVPALAATASVPHLPPTAAASAPVQQRHPLVPLLPLQHALSPPSPIKEESETARSALGASTATAPLGSHRAQALVPAALHMPLAIGPLEQGRRQSLLPQTAASMALASGLPPLPPTARASTAVPPVPAAATAPTAPSSTGPSASTVQSANSAPLPPTNAPSTPASLQSVSGPSPAASAAAPPPLPHSAGSSGAHVASSAPRPAALSVGAPEVAQEGSLVSPSAAALSASPVHRRAASQAEDATPQLASPTPAAAVAATTVAAATVASTGSHTGAAAAAAPGSHAPASAAGTGAAGTPVMSPSRPAPHLLTLDYNPIQEPSWMPGFNGNFADLSLALQAVREVAGDATAASPTAEEAAAQLQQQQGQLDRISSGSAAGSQPAPAPASADGVDVAAAAWAMGPGLRALPEIETVTGAPSASSAAGTPGAAEGSAALVTAGPSGDFGLAGGPITPRRAQRYREMLEGELASARGAHTNGSSALIWSSTATGVTLRTSTAGTPPLSRPSAGGARQSAAQVAPIAVAGPSAATALVDKVDSTETTPRATVLALAS